MPNSQVDLDSQVDPRSQIDTVLDAAVAAVGGSERSGQRQMAHAVDRALTTGEHLLIQAGTGTGKSLGYLVPSIVHGKRVVVATATLALQHQLIERDIPALLTSARQVLDEVPQHAVIKGRSNYACLHRVREGAPDDQGTLVDVPEGSLGAEVVSLREWSEEQAASKRSGARDDAPSHTDRAWRQVSVSHRECLGASRCRYASECFAERAREVAQNADVVITNHALLAIDAIEGVPVLPEYDAVIVDEAHELVGRVTQAATAELDPTMIHRAAKRAQAHSAGSDTDALTEAADLLAEVLTRTEDGRIDTLEDEMQLALASVRDAARACFSALTPQESEKSEPDAAKQQARALLDELRTTAERMVQNRETEALWKAFGRQGAILQIAPIDVSMALRDKLFAEKTVVLTSATLALGDSFGPIASSVGLGKTGWTGLDVGSPFDYGTQGILYAAKHLPPPGREGLLEPHLAEICSLISAAGGRTLGLFSSKRAAEQAAEAVRNELPDLEILCQGDAHLAELTRRFAADPAASLFGTLSLWQGIDVPGSACQLVIIDRIPFPRPDDPLMSARQRLVEKRGGNGFMSVAATHAALLLAQGAGRLIRRSDDRGVVAVLDPRLVTARYGGFLAASLPPMWRTVDHDTVVSALTRLRDQAAI